MSSINRHIVSIEKHKELLSKFPEHWKQTLLMYTGEELFYFYKLCCMKVIKNGDNTKDMFFLALKNKFYAYMNQDKRLDKLYPISGDAWIKLHHKFRYAFEQYVDIEEDEVFDVQKAKEAYAKEQAGMVKLDVTKAIGSLNNKFKRLA
jgi:hypothetical protein